MNELRPFTLEELTRHEKQLEDYPDVMPKYETIQRYIVQIRQLLDELTRKDDENQVHREAVWVLSEKYQAQAKEIERLKLETIDEVAAIGNLEYLLEKKTNELQALREENERLTIQAGINNDLGSTLIKAQEENTRLKEWMATVINSYHHVMTYGLSQEGITLIGSQDTK